MDRIDLAVTPTTVAGLDISAMWVQTGLAGLPARLSRGVLGRDS